MVGGIEFSVFVLKGLPCTPNIADHFVYRFFSIGTKADKALIACIVFGEIFSQFFWRLEIGGLFHGAGTNGSIRINNQGAFSYFASTCFGAVLIKLVVAVQYIF